MNSESYIELVGCILITALTGVVVTCAIWFAMLVYTDFVEKHQLKKWRKETLKDKK